VFPSLSRLNVAPWLTALGPGSVRRPVPALLKGRRRQASDVRSAMPLATVEVTRCRSCRTPVPSRGPKNVVVKHGTVICPSDEKLARHEVDACHPPVRSPAGDRGCESICPAGNWAKGIPPAAVEGPPDPYSQKEERSTALGVRPRSATADVQGRRTPFLVVSHRDRVGVQSPRRTEKPGG
jgi:hypothetical protein